jgi:hypothetical protein
MSYAAVNKVYKTTARQVNQYGNSFRGGILVWELVGEICDQKFDILNRDLSWWKIHSNPKLTHEQQTVLLWTYDFAVARPEHVSQLATALHKVADDISTIINTDSCFHEVADDIMNIRFDKRCLGLGFTVTSVNDIWQCHYNKSQDIFYLFD